MLICTFAGLGLPVVAGDAGTAPLREATEELAAVARCGCFAALLWPGSGSARAELGVAPAPPAVCLCRVVVKEVAVKLPGVEKRPPPMAAIVSVSPGAVDCPAKATGESRGCARLLTKLPVWLMRGFAGGVFALTGPGQGDAMMPGKASCGARLVLGLRVRLRQMGLELIAWPCCLPLLNKGRARMRLFPSSFPSGEEATAEVCTDLPCTGRLSG